MPSRFLWIAHFYPPVNAITGLRTASLAKYFPEFGWTPVILTRRWDGETGQIPPPDVETVRTDYRDRLSMFRRRGPAAQSSRTPDLRSRLRQTAAFWAKEVLTYPDEYTGWKPFALEAGRKIIEQYRPDLILSTSYPFSSHQIGYQLHKETGLPWVAEYQDPWTEGPAWSHSAVRRFFETRLEKRLMRGAAALTIVSQPWAEGLRVQHEKPVAMIGNGFDPVNYTTPQPPQTEQFTITYTGMIYSGDFAGHRDPSLLFEAVKVLLEDGTLDPARFAIRFYGPLHEQAVILQLAQKFGIERVVTHYGQVAHQESILRQRESTLLLLLNWQSRSFSYRERGWYSAKVYEYLAALRPILAVPGHAEVDALLAETASGTAVNTLEEACQALRAWYREYHTTGQVSYPGSAAQVGEHSNRAHAQRFAALFDEVIAVESGKKRYIAPHIAR